MKPTQELHGLNQSLWLDNLGRGLLETGRLRRYIDDLSITGLTSNPTIFERAIRETGFYDAAIRRKMDEGKSGEALFFELALEDIVQAADLFRPIFDATNGDDGWVSLELPSSLADNAESMVNWAKVLHQRADRSNVFIKIPGTPEGCTAIEEAIFAGVPVNVTLLFSTEQYEAAVDAYLGGIERRLTAGLDPVVPSVASIFISRWDTAVRGRVPGSLHGRLGIAIAKRTYQRYRERLAAPRWQSLASAGARPQRVLWASTGTKDPEISDVFYPAALAAPDTIITLPEATLLAFADHGTIEDVLPADGGDAGEVLARFAQAGVDVGTLAEDLLYEGLRAFDVSWDALMQHLTPQRDAVSTGMSQSSIVNA